VLDRHHVTQDHVGGVEYCYQGALLSEQASLGLLVAVSALLLEMQGKVSYRYQQGSHTTASKHDL
jgi:hypothetical protein